MKQVRKMVGTGLTLLGVLWAAVLLTGCGTQGPKYADFPDLPGAMRENIDLFHAGDLVTINFVALSSEKSFQPYEERIRANGTITPPDVGAVQAAGKTAGELQQELQAKYDKLYRGVTVTVKAENRFYYVDGEVRQPGPKPYLAATDIVNAIAAAGGFTDFAKKSNVRIIHPNGKIDIVDYEKAVEDPTFNVTIYPRDQVVVRRRLF